LVVREVISMPKINPSKPGIAEQLEHLAELHRKGALSTDEYAAAKATVLSGQKFNSKHGWFALIGGWIQLALVLFAILLLFIFIIMVCSGYRFGIPVKLAWNKRLVTQ
jgi:hypothetical protein